MILVKVKKQLKKIENFAHDNEKAFQAPIKRIVGMFTKMKKRKKIIYLKLFML